MKDLLTINEIKSKSVIIDGNLHNKFKVMCKGRSLKIGGVIEDLIRLYLNDPKKIQGLVEELRTPEIIDYEKLHKDS